MGYSSIASSSFCGTLTNDCYRFLLEMHGQFLGNHQTPAGQPTLPKKGAIEGLQALW